MSRILVLGGGVVGLSTAVMLRRDGHDVIVLERDREARPASAEEAWHTWERRGVGQFRQPHYLQPAGLLVIETHLPEVKAALLRAGGTTFAALSLMPASITDRAPRPGDDRFTTIAVRRPVLEHAVAGVADSLLEVRRGMAVTGVLTGPAAANGVPHVTGVRLGNGEAVHADLMIDAMGRRSPLPDWLAAVGARRPLEEAEDQGFVYYSRFLRSTTGRAPEFRAALLTHLESFSLLTLPGDADTWSVTVCILAGDHALKNVRDLALWTALVTACPLHAHLVDATPISGLVSLGGILDRYRRFVIDGTPVATGILAVGDAWACTNPSLGRGVAMGLLHAAGTAEAVRQHLGDPLALARAQDAATEARVAPWYRSTVEIDRVRVAQLNAVRDGRPVEASTSPAARVRQALAVGARYDADVFRALIEMTSLLALPQEVLARRGLVDAIMNAARGHEPVAPPGPSRAETLKILS